MRRRTTLAVATCAGLLLSAAPASPARTPAAAVPLPLPVAMAATVAAAPRPLGPGGSWRLVFRDEFGGTRLDRRTWRPNWLGPDDRSITKPVNDLELSCYDPAQVSVRDGALRLRADRRACRDRDGRTYPFASGLVQTYADLQLRRGFVQARMHLPPGAGGSCGPNWAAFWINGLPGRPRRDEIDVMECLGRNVEWHHHFGPDRDRQEESRTPRRWRGTMPGGGGWHTFGVDWTRRHLTFWYDGRRVGTTTRGVSSAPHYLILNLALSQPRVRVPQVLKVDHVRVWRRR